jgi:hypothetical protein
MKKTKENNDTIKIVQQALHFKDTYGWSIRKNLLVDILLITAVNDYHFTRWNILTEPMYDILKIDRELMS